MELEPRDMYSADCFSVSNFFAFLLIVVNTTANVMANINNNNNNNNNNQNNNNNINQNNFNEANVGGGGNRRSFNQVSFWSILCDANDAALAEITKVVEDNPDCLAGSVCMLTST
jgi:hypothetical protein